METAVAQDGPPAKPREIDFRAYKFPINNFVEVASKSDGSKIHNYRWPANADGKAPRAVISML